MKRSIIEQYHSKMQVFLAKNCAWYKICNYPMQMSLFSRSIDWSHPSCVQTYVINRLGGPWMEHSNCCSVGLNQFISVMSHCPLPFRTFCYGAKITRRKWYFDTLTYVLCAWTAGNLKVFSSPPREITKVPCYTLLRWCSEVSDRRRLHCFQYANWMMPKSLMDRPMLS